MLIGLVEGHGLPPAIARPGVLFKVTHITRRVKDLLDLTALNYDSCISIRKSFFYISVRRSFGDPFMPTIEYKCGNCDHLFKMVVFRGDKETETLCPKCKSSITISLPKSESIFNGILNFSTLVKDIN